MIRDTSELSSWTIIAINWRVDRCVIANIYFVFNLLRHDNSIEISGSVIAIGVARLPLLPVPMLVRSLRVDNADTEISINLLYSSNLLL